MNRTYALTAAAAVLALAAGAAHADRGVSWSVGISLPGVTTVIGDGQRGGYYGGQRGGYYAPAPAAYYAPPPAAYSAPPAAYYPPAAAYVAPQDGYYAPLPVARVVVPYRHQHGWWPAPVAYAPPVSYGPAAYYGAGPVVLPRPYGGHWR